MADGGTEGHHFPGAKSPGGRVYRYHSPCMQTTKKTITRSRQAYCAAHSCSLSYIKAEHSLRHLGCPLAIITAASRYPKPQIWTSAASALERRRTSLQVPRRRRCVPSFHRHEPYSYSSPFELRLQLPLLLLPPLRRFIPLLLLEFPLMSPVLLPQILQPLCGGGAAEHD